MRLQVVALASLFVAGGCLGAGPDRTTTAPTGPGEMEYPYGTEFVSVERTDASDVPPLSDPAVFTFENLSERRQDVFLKALEEGQQTFYPDTGPDNPFPGLEIRYVRYEGRWYYVRVAVV